MKRRRFILSIGGASAGAVALIGSGAFTSVEAERQLTVEVVDDPDAFLSLDACGVPSETPNVEYVDIEDGLLSIVLSPDNPTSGGGTGVNSDARTRINNVFQVENQGTQPITFYVDVDPVTDDDGNPAVRFYMDGNPGWNLDEDATQDLAVGDRQCVGIEINTIGIPPGDPLLNDDTITVVVEEN